MSTRELFREGHLPESEKQERGLSGGQDALAELGRVKRCQLAEVERRVKGMVFQTEETNQGKGPGGRENNEPWRLCLRTHLGSVCTSLGSGCGGTVIQARD